MIQFGWYFVLAVRNKQPPERIGIAFRVTERHLEIRYETENGFYHPLTQEMAHCGIEEASAFSCRITSTKRLIPREPLSPFVNCDNKITLSDVAAAHEYMGDTLLDVVLRGSYVWEEIE